MRKRVLVTSLLLVLGALAVWAAGFFIQSWAMLDLDKINSQPLSSVVYDRDGEAAHTLSGAQDRTYIALDDIPEYVQKAFLAAEDARFYSHCGIDFYRVGGALLSNIKSGDYSQGASTITQQLVKLTHLTSAKTIERKAREAILALRLELMLTKDEILQAYINTVYFGRGVYGLEAASRRFLGVGAGELSLGQGAFLAGLIKSPSGYDPYNNHQKAINRRDMILRFMAELGYISQSEADDAIAGDIKLAPIEDTSRVLWFSEQAASEAARLLGISYDEILSGGYSIYTALDVDLQQSAQTLFDDAANFPSDAPDGTPAQAALVCADVDTGEVVAVVGGRNRSVARGLNRATDMHRQPGSAFKPISVYAAAIDRFGYMPTSFVDDTKREFDGGYAPGNVSDSYNGLVTLRQALSRSLNVASVDLMCRVGVRAASEYAERCGIDMSGEGSNLSIALGSLTKGVSPVEMACAYAPLANGGQSVKPHFIRSIRDANGELAYQYSQNKPQIMSPSSARLITDMLITAARSGTAKSLGQLPFQVAGKTGTVGEGNEGNRDVWSVAYTPKLSVCVWMGFDDPGPRRYMSNAVTGSSHPTRLAAKFITQNARAFDGGDFATPNSLVRVPIDTKALSEKHKPMLISDITPKSHTVNELFLKSNAPTAVSDVWKAPSTVFDLHAVREGAIVRIYFTAVDDYALYRIYQTSADDDVLIAEKSASAGERIAAEYATQDSAAGYYVVPYEKTLLSQGVELVGKASPVVYESRNINLYNGASDAPQMTVTEEKPLFS